jgi:hypothetical protein
VQPLRGCGFGRVHPHRAALLRCGVTVGLTKAFALRAIRYSLLLTPYSLLLTLYFLTPYSLLLAPGASHAGAKVCAPTHRQHPAYGGTVSLLFTSYSLLPYSLLFTSCTGGRPCGRKSLRPYSPSAPRLRQSPHSPLFTSYLLSLTSYLLASTARRELLKLTMG